MENSRVEFNVITYIIPPQKHPEPPIQRYGTRVAGNAIYTNVTDGQ